MAVVCSALAEPISNAGATAPVRRGLLAVANERGVWTINEDGGGQRPVLDAPCFPGFPSAAFSADGGWLAVLAYDPCLPHYDGMPGAIQLTLARMNGPQRHFAVTVPPNPEVNYQTFDGPQFSPDGKTVAYAVGPTSVSARRYSSQIVLVDLRTGHVRLIVSVPSRKPPLRLEAATSAQPFAFSPTGDDIA
jgi:hypothetical protein